MTRDALWQDWIADAKAVSIADAIKPYAAKLRRSRREFVGPCPACGGTDRFSVHLDKGVFNCRGAGRGGDALAMVEYLEGVDFLRACEILTGRPRPDGQAETEAERAERERARSERNEAAAAEAARRERDQAAYREAERKRCWRIWLKAAPIALTDAEAYLRLRGLTAPRGAPFRFLAHHDLYADGGRDAPVVHSGPALLAAITSPDGRFAGLHATWIDLSDADGKARVPDPETGELLPARKARGSVRGNRIELVRCPAPRMLFVGEGRETVLSVWQALSTRPGGIPSHTAFWSAIDLGNLAGPALDRIPHPTERIVRTDGRDGGPRKVPGREPDLSRPALVLPDSVDELILLGDGDSEPFFTRLAMERAARRHALRADGRPRLVRIAMAPDGRDFNDILREAA